MQFLRLFAFAPLALASTIGRRDANAVYDDISGIDTAVRQLTAAVNAYNGGIIESRAVLDASISVHAINRQGFSDATSSSAFSEADSKRIVNHVSDSVGISIPESVKAIEAKKPLFDAADITSVVEATINLLKSDHETFSAAVGTKLTLDQAPAGLAAAGAIEKVLVELSLYYAV